MRTRTCEVGPNWKKKHHQRCECACQPHHRAEKQPLELAAGGMQFAPRLLKPATGGIVLNFPCPGLATRQHECGYGEKQTNDKDCLGDAIRWRPKIAERSL